MGITKQIESIMNDINVRCGGCGTYLSRHNIISYRVDDKHYAVRCGLCGSTIITLTPKQILLFTSPRKQLSQDKFYTEID